MMSPMHGWSIKGAATAAIVLWALAFPPGTSGTTVINPDGTTSRAPAPGPNPFGPAPSDTVHIGLPPVLDPVPQIKDPVFGLLIGLVSNGVYGKLSGTRLAAELDRLHLKSPLPYQTLDTLTRMPVRPGRTATVKVTFHGDLSLPIPYSILGYHPGSFSTSQTCVFREWIFNHLVLEDEDDHKPPRPFQVELDDVHLLAVEKGKVLIDFDDWLDALMGDKLDDTYVTGLLLCRHQGEWLGFAMGYNRKGEGRSGALSFQRDKILFPTPTELRVVGPRMRSQMESLMKWWAAEMPPAGNQAGRMPQPLPH